MLTHIQIINLAIVENISLELHEGLTVITGETGAGKSIIIDALGLVLGNRASASIVRPGTERAEIAVDVDLAERPEAAQWLVNHDLNEPELHCQLRRIITKDGRSKTFINGRSVPLHQLKTLGKLLVNIHGQHEHLSLLSKEHQYRHVDQFAGHDDLLKKLRESYQHWHEATQQFHTLNEARQHRATRMELLRYQVEELEAFEPKQGEWEALQKQHQELTQAEDILKACQHALDLFNGEQNDNISAQLVIQKQALSSFQLENKNLQTALEFIEQANINVIEAAQELRDYAEHLDLDPQTLQHVEQRISQYFELARKHQVATAELFTHYQTLSDELAQLRQQELTLQTSQEEIDKLTADYHAIADKLSKSRQKHAKKLGQCVTKKITELGMKHGKLVVAFQERREPAIHPHGIDDIEFLVTTNPGQPLQPLGKIVSGGELSRISLAIQVITAQSHYPPSLVFDEVDVGIGGQTATNVGKLIRQLGETTQVLCITHLPQVAAQGHHHILVEKITKRKQTHTMLKALEGEDKTAEITRMLGGDANSDQVRAHAEALLSEEL